MKNIQNKWIRAAIPALLLHCSIGTVYCWSIFSQEIADYIGFSKSATEWAFSFAIFFLGMSAATGLAAVGSGAQNRRRRCRLDYRRPFPLLTTYTICKRDTGCL